MRAKLGLLVFLIVICFSACGTADERSAEENSQLNDSTTKTPITIGELPNSANQITGILQTSGLQPQEIKALGLSEGKYQLISQEAYFVEGNDSLQYYLGQCITLEGELQQENLTEADKTQQTTYKRKIFRVEKISAQLYSLCYFSDTTLTQPQGREVTYTGHVERMERPAPDIAYDYQLRLQQPYRDENNPINPGKLVRTLPLVTADFEILSVLETALYQKKQLQLKGIQHQGYAESKALWVITADSISL